MNLKTLYSNDHDFTQKGALLSSRHFKVSFYDKMLERYLRLQFYGLYVPILDETPYIVTKCTVRLNELKIDYSILPFDCMIQKKFLACVFRQTFEKCIK